MPIYVKRRPKETNNALIRRFMVKTYASGIVKEFRHRMFTQPVQSVREEKEQALRRVAKSEEIAKKRRLGLM